MSAVQSKPKPTRKERKERRESRKKERRLALAAGTLLPRAKHRFSFAFSAFFAAHSLGACRLFNRNQNPPAKNAKNAERAEKRNEGLLLPRAPSCHEPNIGFPLRSLRSLRLILLAHVGCSIETKTHPQRTQRTQREQKKGTKACSCRGHPPATSQT